MEEEKKGEEKIQIQNQIKIRLVYLIKNLSKNILIIFNLIMQKNN